MKKVHIIFFIICIIIIQVYLYSSYVVEAQDLERITYYVSYNIYNVYNISFKYNSFKGGMVLELEPYQRNNNFYIKLVLRHASYEEYKIQQYYIALKSLELNQFLDKEEREFFTEIVKGNETLLMKSYEEYLEWVPDEIPIIIIYEIDQYNNYLVNFSNYGFFPLYSFNPLDEDFFDEQRPVILGTPLRFEGYVSVSFDRYNISVNDIFVEVYADTVRVDGYDMGPLLLYYKYHYLALVHGKIALPLNSSHYLVVDLEPTKETLEFVLSLPPYDPAERARQLRLVVFSVIAVVLLLAVVAVVRRVRGR